jgi:hypothetical protein
MLGDMPNGEDLELMATCLEHYGWAEFTALLGEEKPVNEEILTPLSVEQEINTQERLSA